MQDKSPSKPISFIRRHKVALIILTPIAILLLLAYGIPAIVGDGTGRFSGREKLAATYTLQSISPSFASQDWFLSRLNGELQYYVEDVLEMPVQDVKKYCKHTDDKDDGTGYYYAKISQVTLFGFRIERGDTNASYTACIVGKKLKNTP